MKADVLRDEKLGRWSSHPKWIGWRRKWFQRAAAVPAIVAIVIALFNPIDVWNWRGLWLTTLIAFIAFGGAAVLSIILCARLGESERLALIRQRTGMGRFKMSPGKVVAAIAIGVFVPALISWLIPFTVVKWLCLFLAFGPFTAIWFGMPSMEKFVERKMKEAERQDELQAIIKETSAGDAKGRRKRYEVEDDSPPQWLDLMLESLGTRVNVEQRAALLAQDAFSPLSNRVDLAHIFGGEQPTDDQARVFQAFCDGFEKLVHESTRPGEVVAPSADIIVHGDAGSGRTTTLQACATFAAFVRGQRVLFFVPNALRQQVILDHLQRFLDDLGLSHYVRAAPVNEANVRAWLKAEEPVPNVLVAELPAYEEHILGDQNRSGEMFDRLRRLALLPEVVIVDDFLDFDDVQRSHLPFVLDKQRLLLAAEFMALQVVIACPTLSEIGKEILSRRLFTLKRFNPDNVIALRPRPIGQAWSIKLSSENATADVVKDVARECLSQDLRVAVYRQGIDEQQCRREEQELAKLGGDNRIEVMSNLTRHPVDPAKIDVVIYYATQGGDLALPLRLHLGHDETVLIGIVVDETKHEQIEGVVPVIAERYAVPLLVSHFRSIARFIHPHTPVDADAWRQFGIEYDRITPADEPVSVLDTQLDVDDWSDPFGQLQLSPYVALSRCRQLPEPVATHRLPQTPWRLYRSSSGRRVFLGVAESAVETGAVRASRYANWCTPTGQDFGRAGEVDLAHLYELRLVYGNTVFGPRAIEQHADGQIQITTDIWRGNGADRYLPVFKMQWDLDRPQEAASLWGSTSDGLRWFNLKIESPAGVTMNAGLIGHMSRQAKVTDIQTVNFDYACEFSGLILQPSSIEREALRETVGNNLMGSWSTAPDSTFWPELTGAIHYALNIRAKGLAYYARVLAFELTDAAADLGQAIVWFVEPLTGGNTSRHVIERILTHPDERQHLFSSMAWYLQQMKQSSLDPRQFFRQYTGTGYDGDRSGDRMDKALELVERIASAGEMK